MHRPMLSNVPMLSIIQRLRDTFHAWASGEPKGRRHGRETPAIARHRKADHQKADHQKAYHRNAYHRGAPHRGPRHQGRRDPRVWLGIVMVAGSLTACGGPSHTSGSDATNAPAAAATSFGIDLPPEVAHFERMDIRRRNDGNDVTAGYAFDDGADPVIATVHVRPVADDHLFPLFTGNRIADLAAATRPLEASVAQVRHFYPHAELRDVRPVYLVKRGVLQGGQAATLRYVDTLAGQRQKIDLDIYMFCCVDGRNAYEFRIRHAADNNVGPLAVSFLQALSWSPGSGTDK